MIDVAIVGASGYAARELFRILLNHPGARVALATSRQDEGTRVDALHPSLARRVDLACEPFDPDRVAVDNVPAGPREQGRRVEMGVQHDRRVMDGAGGGADLRDRILGQGEPRQGGEDGGEGEAGRFHGFRTLEGHTGRHSGWRGRAPAS